MSSEVNKAPLSESVGSLDRQVLVEYDVEDVAGMLEGLHTNELQYIKSVCDMLEARYYL